MGKTGRVDRGSAVQVAPTLNSRAPEPASEGNAMERSIGQQARAFRHLLDLTIEEVARLAEVAPGTLSKIETGAISPSLSTLRSLARALNVPITAFFRKFEEERHAVHLNAAKAPVVERRGTKLGLRYQLLGNPIKRSRVSIEPCLITIDPPFDSRGASLQHNGVEFLYVLDGTLTYRHGDRIYTLSPGESLFFDGDIPHGPESATQSPVKLISVAVQPRFDE